MRELMDIIKSRRSTRSFIPNKLPPREQVEQLVLAAQWAPSGMGKYLWHLCCFRLAFHFPFHPKEEILCAN